MAFTATRNLPLAATTTGSWPRPAWYSESLWGRPLDSAMLDPIYREQFSDALAIVVDKRHLALGRILRRRALLAVSEPRHFELHFAFHHERAGIWKPKCGAEGT